MCVHPKSRNRNSALFTIIASIGFVSCSSPHLRVRLKHETNPMNTSIAKIARILFRDLGIVIESYFIESWVKSGMEHALTFTLILLTLELFEAFVQHAPTLGGVIERLYGWYRKSIFLFFLVHPTFYFILYVVMETGVLNFYMIVIIAMKIFDIFYKLELIKGIYIKQRIPAEMAAMLEWRIPSWFFLTGVLLYVPLLYYALQM